MTILNSILYHRDDPDPKLVVANHSTYARDGWSIFEPSSHVKFIVYGLISFFLYVLAQLPAYYNIKVNVDLITDAVTFEDPETQKRVKVPRWLYGPGYHFAHDAHHDTEAAAAAGFSSCEDAKVAAKAEGFDDFSVARKTIFTRWRAHVKEVKDTIPVAYQAELLAKMAKHDVSSGSEYVAQLDRWVTNRNYRCECCYDLFWTLLQYSYFSQRWQTMHAWMLLLPMTELRVPKRRVVQENRSGNAKAKTVSHSNIKSNIIFTDKII